MMHTAICSECEKECEVPFKPSGDRPIFCRNCFRKREDTNPEKEGGREFDKKDFSAKNFDGRDSRRDTDRDGGGRSFGKKKFVFGRKKGENPKPEGNKEISDEHFRILNEKLDKILNTLGNR